jgi:hypothetical protein
MKKRATQINTLFLRNMPALQSNSEMKEAPSGSSWRLSFLGSNNVTALAFLLVPYLLDIDYLLDCSDEKIIKLIY